ncbi:MAG: integrase arm-type DNA-binding domain-containing protein [Parvibaculum sp.]|nr:integrase arm-type DNA-binding domain-containing protein [Parvibaculum sp.]
MARSQHKLTAVKVARLTKPGRYGDGGGLWLQVAAGGSRSWLFRFMRDGKAREMGLGALMTVTLAEAREKARECRKALSEGLDPIEARDGIRKAAAVDAARAVTFREAAERYIEAHRPGWKNAKHADQWGSTLEAYVYPTIGALPVAAVDVALVLKCIEPIWSTKPETAGRVRGRIESVLDWAAARGYRTGDNPARWRGHLDKLLPPKSKVAKVKHHAAMPYADVPAFMAELRDRSDNSSRCLEFAVLTASRTGEAIGARLEEIDLSAKVWTIPAERMKGGREHRAPLSDRALEIVRSMPREGDFVFPGAKAGQPLSNMALLMTLRRMGHEDLTAHGFRSSFRDWAAEQTAFPNEVAEMALAHAVGDKVEAAYRRGDLLAKRRQLMDAWAKFCSSPRTAGADVLPIKGMRA